MGLTKAILLAVMHIESGFNPAARSVADAKSLMQLTPIAEREVCIQYGCEPGYDVWHPPTNVDMGAKLLQFYLEEARGDVYGMIVLYSAGYVGYNKYLRREPLPAETEAYLKKFKLLRSYYANLFYLLPEEMPPYYDLVDDALGSDNLFDRPSLLIGPPRY
jgi:soluble lytic murein transglycosylase-like protein